VTLEEYDQLVDPAEMVHPFRVEIDNPSKTLSRNKAFAKHLFFAICSSSFHPEAAQHQGLLTFRLSGC
jgi:hypothetical protein